MDFIVLDELQWGNWYLFIQVLRYLKRKIINTKYPTKYIQNIWNLNTKYSDRPEKNYEHEQLYTRKIMFQNHRGKKGIMKKEQQS